MSFNSVKMTSIHFCDGKWISLWQLLRDFGIFHSHCCLICLNKEKMQTVNGMDVKSLWLVQQTEIE